MLVGYRTALPAGLGSALIGYQDGVACYDALHDPELADVLLAGMSEQRLAGQLRFVREPGAPVLAGQVPDGRVLGAEQSNTSLVFGDQAILKVLRRLFPGANPDLEVADALARLGSTSRRGALRLDRDRPRRRAGAARRAVEVPGRGERRLDARS